jgi:hypothetical protein
MANEEMAYGKCCWLVIERCVGGGFGDNLIIKLLSNQQPTDSPFDNSPFAISSFVIS